MSDKQFTVDTAISILNYQQVVYDLVDGYLNTIDEENIAYIPHIGLINTMRLFYNNCVKGDAFGVPHNTESLEDMAQFAYDEDFLRVFNEGLEGDGYRKFDFANAHQDALKIVKQKLKSDNIYKALVKVSDYASKSITDLLASFSQVISTTNPEELSAVLQESLLTAVSNVEDDTKEG